MVCRDGKPDRWVRLIGVGVPGSADAAMPAPFIGAREPDALERWLSDREVLIRDDPAITRILTRRAEAYAHAGRDRADVGLELIRAGYAYVRRDQDFARRSDYLLAEAEARATGRGYWPTPAPPAEPEPTPLRSDPIVVARDPAGSKSAYAARARTIANRKAARARRAASYAAATIAAQEESGGFGLGSMMMFAPSPGTHHVNGYYRRDGTHVRGYMRTNPDGSLFNNFSHRP